MRLEEKINYYAAGIGLITGICGGGPVVDDITKFIKTTTPFVKYSAEERADPRLSMPGCRSIIVAGMGYRKKYLFENDGLPRGVLSQGAIGTDYHISMREKLGRLAGFMLGFADFNYQINVDNGPLSEKDLLIKAGLGRRGRNGLIYSDKFGSFFFAGYMLTDLDLEPTFYRCGGDVYNGELNCGNCRLCIGACPGGALRVGGFDYTKCGSYLTQKKGELNDEEKKIIGLNLYGCDICQEVCPFNAETDTEAEEITDVESARPELMKIIEMTKNEFDEKYKNTALYWRGMDNLKRNARAALKNFNSSTSNANRRSPGP